MLVMKTTRELAVGDRGTMDDMEILVVETGQVEEQTGWWLVTYVDIDTRERAVVDIDPADVDVPLWEIHNPE